MGITHGPPCPGTRGRTSPRLDGSHPGRPAQAPGQGARCEGRLVLEVRPCSRAAIRPDPCPLPDGLASGGDVGAPRRRGQVQDAEVGSSSRCDGAVTRRLGPMHAPGGRSEDALVASPTARPTRQTPTPAALRDRGREWTDGRPVQNCSAFLPRGSFRDALRGAHAPLPQDRPEMIRIPDLGIRVRRP